MRPSEPRDLLSSSHLQPPTPMATVPLTPALRAEYDRLFDACTVRPGGAASVEKTANDLLAHRARYANVERDAGVPWHVVAVLHCLEASLSFKAHLHNGDPLTARTVQVPKGCPKTGAPPFTWEASAADALALKGLGRATDWSRAGTLYQLERYNGFGYRLHHAHVRTPYLWGFSNHYTAGKYVKDGVWSDTAVSKQIGGATLRRRLAERGVVRFADDPPDASKPLVVPYAAAKPTDAGVLGRAKTLQAWLNTHGGVTLRVDGWAGRGTSDAYRRVTGGLLPGDPRT